MKEEKMNDHHSDRCWQEQPGHVGSCGWLVPESFPGDSELKALYRDICSWTRKVFPPGVMTFTCGTDLRSVHCEKGALKTKKEADQHGGKMEEEENKTRGKNLALKFRYPLLKSLFKSAHSKGPGHEFVMICALISCLTAPYTTKSCIFKEQTISLCQSLFYNQHRARMHYEWYIKYKF